MTPRRLLVTVLGLGAAAVVAAIVLHGQDDSADANRLIERLGLQPGSVVAEIGAGSGSLTIAIARHVGPSGRVYSSELGERALGRLRDAVAGSGAANIEVVEGQAAQANLPDGCCDAIFMRDVYHHFSEPSPMNASFYRALRPGGRLAIFDFPPRGSHGVSPDTVVDALRSAGFAIVSSEDPPGRLFIVVAEKPAP